MIIIMIMIIIVIIIIIMIMIFIVIMIRIIDRQLVDGSWRRTLLRRNPPRTLGPGLLGTLFWDIFWDTFET